MNDIGTDSADDVWQIITRRMFQVNNNEIHLGRGLQVAKVHKLGDIHKERDCYVCLAVIQSIN